MEKDIIIQSEYIITKGQALEATELFIHTNSEWVVIAHVHFARNPIRINSVKHIIHNKPSNIAEVKKRPARLGFGDRQWMR